MSAGTPRSVEFLVKKTTSSVSLFQENQSGKSLYFSGFLLNLLNEGKCSR